MEIVIPKRDGYFCTYDLTEVFYVTFLLVKHNIKYTSDERMICMSKCERLQYARAYIVLQKYENLYSMSEALYKGTLFADLYRPYKKSKY